MSHLDGGDDTNYPENTTLPDDDDDLDVASVNVGFEALLDRTATLRKGLRPYVRDWAIQIDDSNDGQILNIGPLAGQFTSRLVVLPELAADLAITLRDADGAGGTKPAYGTVVRISRGRRYNAGSGGLPNGFTVTIASGSESGGVDLIEFDVSATAHAELIFMPAGFGYPADGWRVLSVSGGVTYLF